MSQRAIFLDRDGTLVQHVRYPSRPEQLVLYDNFGPELRAVQRADFRIVVITNQSGMARGYFTEDDLSRMHDHLVAALAGISVRVDGIYFCPHHEDGVVPELAVRCECRKPQPGMLLRAAAELDLDLDRSWFIGDSLDDVEAGNRAGCRSILVDLGTEGRPPQAVRCPNFVARDTRHALRIVRAVEALGETAELNYQPVGWALTPNVGSATRGTSSGANRRG